MKTPERLALEEALKNDPPGSVNIRALACFAELKDVEYRLAHLRPRMSEFSRWQLETRKICIEYEIEKWKYTAEVIEFEEAFASAGQTLAPYYEAHENPGLIIVDDLKEINLEKSRRRAFLKLDNPQRR